MNTNDLQIGTRVSYEDMANPRQDGTIVELVELGGTTPSGLPLPTGLEYRVRWDDGDEVVSDCRQAGWKVLPVGRYSVKCDDCRQDIRRTDSVAESAAGGRCDDCHEELMRSLSSAGVEPARIAAMRRTRSSSSSSTSIRHAQIRPATTSRWVQEDAGRDDALAGLVDEYLLAQSPHYRRGHDHGAQVLEVRS